MQTISKQIVAARKAAGMTQEQLAERMHVTRATISHWEVGRHVPDLDSVRRLSEALNTHFILENGESHSEEDGKQILQSELAEIAPEESASDHDDVQEPSLESGSTALETTRNGNREKTGNLSIRYLSIIAGIVLLTVVIVILFNGRSKPQSDKYVSGASDGTVYQIEDYTSQATRTEGHAYLAIDRNSSLQQGQDMTLWMFTFTIREDQGYPFHIQRIDVIWFLAEGKAAVQTYSEEILETNDVTTQLDAWETTQFTGGMPHDPEKVDGVAIRVYGHDETGENMDFSSYIPCPKE